MNALDVSDLVSGYGQLKVVRDVSMTVGEGEIVTVVGPNGAGKSTLMSTIAGVRPSWSGRITLEGADISKYSSARRLRRGLGWVPEGRNVFSDLTVRDNLYLSCYMAKLRNRFDELEAGLLEEFPVLAKYRDTKAGALSGGQAQILALSRVLIRCPSVVLLDEPTIGLSPAIVSVLANALAERAKTGMSWLVAEQNLGWLADITSGVHVMLGGRIVRSGTAELLTDRNKLKEIYFGVQPEQAKSG